MATIQELKQKAAELKKKGDFENALPLFREIWEKEKSDWNAYFLALCLRKTDNFTEAREIHQFIKNFVPNFRPIQNEELWLDYSEKIKDWANPDLLSDAEALLAKTNMHDERTGMIYNKTVLSVVKHLIYKGDNPTALEWLEKLDFVVLSTSPFNYRGQKFASDQKAFFIRYSDVLIKLDKHIDYIESCLTCLNFDGLKHTQFKKRIIEEITFGDYISRVVLALYLKFFKEEIYFRKKGEYTSIYNPNKITLISDLADFEFCPASFAINETFSVVSNGSWEKDEWLGDKKHLIDRYNEYQKSKNISAAFNDSSIEINEATKNDFNSILNSKLIINNFDGSNTTFYSNTAGTLRGNPDYVFENVNSQKFVVIEKFTKRTSENVQTAFPNDLIKLYGYIFELNSLNIEFGYLIYWYWQYDDIESENGTVKKKIRIKSYRLFKVEKSAENKNKLVSSIEKVQTFKKSKQFSVEGDKISHANKCLRCSVVSYCNHKTGKFNLIKLPYDINSLKVTQEPKTATTTSANSNSIDDDLPF